MLTALAGERRCVAIDLPLHGRTPVAPDQEFSLGAFATFVADVCDTLGLADVDLVANDTGGAVAQIVAARRPERLRSLTLTNCETEGNVPPWAFLPAVGLARVGLLAPFLGRRRSTRAACTASATPTSRSSPASSRGRGRSRW